MHNLWIQQGMPTMGQSDPTIVPAFGEVYHLLHNPIMRRNRTIRVTSWWERAACWLMVHSQAKVRWRGPNCHGIHGTIHTGAHFHLSLTARIMNVLVRGSEAPILLDSLTVPAGTLQPTVGVFQAIQDAYLSRRCRAQRLSIRYMDPLPNSQSERGDRRLRGS